MMFTARQLAELNKAAGGKGQVVLPYRARLTPLALDLVRSGKITVGYSDAAATPAPAAKEKSTSASTSSTSAALASGEYLWWCDGPCGPAKAAITMESRQLAMRQIDPPPGSDALVAVIKTLASQVKSGKSAGGVLVVESAGPAVVMANRAPSLRAIVGTSMAAIEHGVNQIAANVLVIEHPRLSLSQVKNLLARFLRAKRELSESARKSLLELAGGAGGVS
jgi:hypothetical protein